MRAVFLYNTIGFFLISGELYHMPDGNTTITYHARLTGNKSKLEHLDKLHCILQEMSKFMFDNFDWTDKKNCKFSKDIYESIRQAFPEVHSKLVQKAMKEYGKFGKAKRPKTPVVLPIIWDYQQFNTEFKGKHYGLFLRFAGKNFPVEGKRTTELLRDKQIQEIRIKKFGKEFRVYFVCRVKDPINTDRNQHKDRNQHNDKTNTTGLDANVKSVVLSNNQFFNLKPVVHQKQETRKGCSPVRNARNYTRNFIRNQLHQISNGIVKSLNRDNTEVLYMEDLTGLRKKQTEKHSSNRELELRFILNNCYPYAMLQEMLQYKCEQKGIKVKFISPAYTSQKCSGCGSLHTRRPTQSRFECLDCGLRLNADVNGARNIQVATRNLNGHLIDSARHALLKVS
jgi:IS605 OrfB family transposase